jgi:cytochrome b561
MPKYDKLAVLLHWSTAALMIYMVTFGEDLMDDDAMDASGATWHATLGVTILLLTVLRLLWRLAHPPPPLPATMKSLEKSVSHITHLVFYVMMIGLPLTGLFGFGEFATEADAAGNATLFGLMPVPRPDIAAGWEWGEFHEVLSKLMYPLIALHVLAALKHQFIDRDGLLRRMT